MNFAPDGARPQMPQHLDHPRAPLAAPAAPPRRARRLECAEHPWGEVRPSAPFGGVGETRIAGGSASSRAEAGLSIEDLKQDHRGRGE
jgi:hypothetical protein